MRSAYSLACLVALWGCHDSSLKVVQAAPTASILTLSDGGEVYESLSEELRGRVNDEDTPVEDLSVRWYQDGDLLCEGPVTDSEGYTTCEAVLDLGYTTVILEAFDPAGNMGSDSASVRVVASTPPEVNLVSPFNGDRHMVGEDITFSGFAIDAEDGASVSAWLESSLEGRLDLDVSLDSYGEFSVVGSLDEGEHEISLIAEDSTGKQAQDTHTITVLPLNNPPEVSGVAISPDPAFVTTPLLCSYETYFDPDEDPDVSTFAWFVDGVEVGTGPTLTEGYGRDDIVACVVHPFDGTEYGTAIETSIVIQNSPPEIDTVQIAPEDVRRNSTLSCTWTDYSDPDGDTDESQVTWTVDGVDAGTAPDITLDAERGDTVSCTVTPFDGTDSGEPKTASVMVGNSPPEVVSAAVVPGLVFTNDEVAVEYETADLDGDSVSVSIQWLVNAELVAETPTLSGVEHFGKGDAITAVLTPYDGFEDGEPVETEPVVVQNTPPTAPTIAITGTPEVDTMCGISVGIDGAWYGPFAAYPGWDPTEVWLGLGSTGEGLGSSGSEWSDLAVYGSGGELLDEDGMTTLSAFEWASGSVGTIEVTGASVLSTADWAFLARTSRAYDVTSGLEVEVDTWWEDTSDFSFWFTADPGVVAPGSGGFGTDSVRLRVSFSHNTYAAGGGPSRLTVRWMPEETTDWASESATAHHEEVEIPPARSGWHTLRVAYEPCGFGVEELVCEVVEPSDDADGDEVEYAFSWVREGEPFEEASDLVHVGDRVSSAYVGYLEAWQCAVTPFDGDDEGDVGEAEYLTAAETLCVSGEETFSSSTLSAGREVQGGAIADIDGDGHMDAAFNEQLDNRIRIFWGDGSGFFDGSATTLVPIGRSGASGDIEDINGDGHMDLVWGSQDANRLWVALGTGGRSFAPSSSYSHPGGPNRVKLVDVDLDGHMDALVRDRFGSCLRRSFGNGDGTFAGSSCLISPNGSVEAADVDGDGLVEIIMVHAGELTKYELDASGDVVESAPIDHWPLDGAGMPHLVDLDGDGALDILMARSGSLAVYRNDGMGNFEGCMYAEDLAHGPVAFGYLNGDDLIDYVAYDTCSYCGSEVFFAVHD